MARSSYADPMTAFGGIFRSPALQGVEGSDEAGERGRIVGLDLDGGVVRVQPGGTTSPAEATEQDPEDRDPEDRDPED